ncbi:MAG: exopolyphosphatase [Gammaproteobacteria bacterium]
MLAAVDLGSNSFHMIVARYEDGQLHVIDRLREMVRLAAGLQADKTLTDEAKQRALECLSRFGERLRELPPGSVRAVGTNTLRRAKGSREFLREAEARLGHPIEIIAGREEARLVYQGVAHSFAGDEEKRLVVDIGGGSTELIIGEGFKTLNRDSLFMGCVSMSQAHFQDGSITEAAMRRAELEAMLELEPVQLSYWSGHWKTAIGSSGTAKALAALIEQQGWSKRGISREGMDKLRAALIEAGHIDKLKLEGLKDERRPILAGGFAVMSGVFRALDVQLMEVSDMALREGLLYDLVGRLQNEDVRDRTVRRLANKLGADKRQAERVEATAMALFDQVKEAWELDDKAHGYMLRWAARLHEVGLVISRGQHHKHGAYMLGNADLAGFSRDEQTILATLVLGHRRRFPQAAFEQLDEEDRVTVMRLCVLLRLAVIFHRSRSEDGPPALKLKVAASDAGKLKLKCPAEWSDAHPLTIADLEEENRLVAAAGFRLKCKYKKPKERETEETEEPVSEV